MLGDRRMHQLRQRWTHQPRKFKQFISFRDTQRKYMFNYPIKTCDEDTFLYYLNRVLRFFTTCGFKPKVLRSDYVLFNLPLC
jgi:hypothetical protein